MFFLTKAFWIAASERAVKSFGQGAVVAFGADKLASAFTLDFVHIAGAGLGMALLSLLTSLASARVGEKGSPSLVSTPPAAEPDLDGIHRTVARH